MHHTFKNAESATSDTHSLIVVNRSGFPILLVSFFSFETLPVTPFVESMSGREVEFGMLWGQIIPIRCPSGRTDSIVVFAFVIETASGLNRRTNLIVGGIRCTRGTLAPICRSGGGANFQILFASVIDTACGYVRRINSAIRISIIEIVTFIGIRSSGRTQPITIVSLCFIVATKTTTGCIPRIVETIGITQLRLFQVIDGRAQGYARRWSCRRSQ